MCPDDVFSKGTKGAVSHWLGRFVMEARRKDGKPYPPKSIHMLLMGIQHHMRELTPEKQVNFFGDPEYHKLKNVCDAFYRQLHASGVGTETKATPVLIDEDEDRLWTSGVINLSTPQRLVNAMFFYNGKNFCLRGGQEHKNHQFSQFKRKVVNVNGYSQVCYEYTEHGSKNRSGGLKQLKTSNKVVVQYEDTQAGERCHVDILAFTSSKCPRRLKMLMYFI